MIRKNKCQFKKVILHVGSEKTGSTSIQHSLNRSRELLLSNGVFYPPGRPGHDHQAIFGSCFTAKADLLLYNHNHDELQSLIARDRDYLYTLEKSFRETQADTLLFSYEGFCHLTIDSFKDMKLFLGKYCDEFQIVFYVRTPLSYAASAMSQRVKMGLRACESDGDIPFVNYQDILERICCVFDKSQINVRFFSKEILPNGNVVLDFLSLLNLPKYVEENIISKGRNKNYSLSQEALVIGDKMAELLNGYIPPIEFNNKRLIGSVFLRAIKGQNIQLTVLQHEEILKHTAPHVEYISREFGITMKNEPSTTRKPLGISETTIEYTAKMLLRILVPDFKRPIEDSARDESKLNRLFILRVMLTAKIFIFIRAAYRRFRPIILAIR